MDFGKLFDVLSQKFDTVTYVAILMGAVVSAILYVTGVLAKDAHHLGILTFIAVFCLVKIVEKPISSPFKASRATKRLKTLHPQEKAILKRFLNENTVLIRLPGTSENYAYSLQLQRMDFLTYTTGNSLNNDIKLTINRKLFDKLKSKPVVASLLN